MTTTRNYVESLFNKIKQMQRDLTTSSPHETVVLINNMKEEYRYLINEAEITTYKKAYGHLGSAKYMDWKPKVTFINPLNP